MSAGDIPEPTTDSAREQLERLRRMQQSPYVSPTAVDAPGEGQPPVFLAELVKGVALPQPRPLFAFLAALGFVVFQLALGIPVAVAALAIWGLRFLEVPQAQWLMIVSGTGATCLGSIVTMPLVYGRGRVALSRMD